jgi:hypothetical protein
MDYPRVAHRHAGSGVIGTSSNVIASVSDLRHEIELVRGRAFRRSNRLE